MTADNRSEVERTSVSLPRDLYRAAELRRESLGKSRSGFYEEALRSYLSRLDEEEMDRRNGLSGQVGQVLDRTRFLARQSTENRVAVERLYVVFEAMVMGEAPITYEEATARAEERIREERRRSAG